jgi:hypothetical protein
VIRAPISLEVSSKEKDEEKKCIHFFYDLITGEIEK